MVKRILFLSVFSLLLLQSCLFDRKERPGFHDPGGPIVWQGMIHLESDYYIAPQDVLIIEEGSTVRFNGSVTLLVEGALHVRGRSYSPVLFPDPGQIVLTGKASGSSLSWCNVTKATLVAAADLEVGFSLIKRLEVISNGSVEVTNSRIGYLTAHGMSRLDVRKSAFDRAGFYNDESVKVVETFDSSLPNLSGNWILGNSAFPLPVTNRTVLHYSSGNARYAGNWWGTADSQYVTNRLLFVTGAAILDFQPILGYPDFLSLPPHP
jgi:hypothetical protein